MRTLYEESAEFLRKQSNNNSNNNNSKSNDNNNNSDLYERDIKLYFIRLLIFVWQD